MSQQRFPSSSSAKDATQDDTLPHVDSEQLDSQSILQQVHAGLATIEATLHDLELETQQHRYRLDQIRGAATLFDEAGLVSEATAMHGGEQTILDALADIERRRAVMLDTAQKLRAARDRLSPPGTNVVGETSAPIWAPADENVVEFSGPKTVQELPRQPTPERPVAPPPTDPRNFASSAPFPASPATPPLATTVAERQSDVDTVTTVPVTSDQESSRRSRKALYLIGGLIVLLLPITIAVVAVWLSGDGDGDGSDAPVQNASLPTTALGGQAPADTPTVAIASTPTVVIGAVAPAPTETAVPVVVMSPTPPLPTLTPIPPTPVPPSPVPPTPTPVQPTVTSTQSPPIVNPTQQPTAVLLDSIVTRVLDAEAALQTGQLNASVEYTDGTVSSTRIDFDFGAADGTAKGAITTTYSSGDQTQTIEQIMVGPQSWERINGGNWQEVSNIEGVWGQVQVFLPRIATVPDPQLASNERPGDLHWYDSSRNVDTTLQVDPDSGIPLVMRQVSRDSGSVLTITYTGWNTPVQIDRPAT